MNIKVLGPGCSNCTRLEKRAKEAVKELNIEATIEKVADYGIMMKYGMLASPGLVINDTLVSSGKVLSVKQLIELIEKHQSL